jgi:hypothetical protein
MNYPSVVKQATVSQAACQIRLLQAKFVLQAKQLTVVLEFLALRELCKFQMALSQIE